MRLERGLVYDDCGRLRGFVVAVEVEMLDGPLTPTQIRAIADCPFCDAPRGAMCRRWRGGSRKANHAERIRAAKVRLA